MNKSSEENGTKGTGKITSMREVKLNEEEKKRLLIMGAGILLALALAIAIVEGLTQQSSVLLYPNHCGNSTSQQGIDTCLSSYANKTSNSTVCLYMQQGVQQSNCILGVAEATQNASVCGVLGQTSGYYPNCILTINKKLKSLALCGYLSIAYALPCMYNISLETNFSNPNACAAIPNKTYSSECASIYYYHDALGTRNQAYCGYLQNRVNATTIYYITYNASQNFTASSQNLFFAGTLNVTPQSYCYFKLALSEMNTSICNSISGPFSTECSYYVEESSAAQKKFNLNATNVTSACGAYSGYAWGLCDYDYLVKKALETKSAAPCALINASVEGDECILQLALNTSNFGYCSQISSNIIKSACRLIANSTKRS
jgi:hypothetical protein